ncbi:hypothetical protein NLX86_17400 [Streptomyces sp. A3M-1-3]|uniref:hypothetical protein n=1 Tax=Streptomyces sp. A3M-1-3 TaxID=2962044 RepID=UPI0020B67028|nr:hypothetical protein [Streptomyces sp. A3M-1-3]MCP3819806.1 hypothetical protein [Streptomyces sp. A3M-1-3]
MGAPLVNAHEWPSGLTLTWSSLTGRWTYSVLDEHGLENTLALPVPALAAPSAVSAVLPALMDGRHGQLPASQERWEHAGLLESWAESAALYGDDRYDAAYQAAEEEAESFLRWQEQLDGEGAVATEPGDGEPAGLTRYRIVAQRTDDAHPGAAKLTNFTYARSVEEAVATVRRANEQPGGLYGDRGLYRVVEVTEEAPASEARQQEDARRRFVTTVMNSAHAEIRREATGVPHSEMYGVLCDFFTRAIVFPGQFGFPFGTADGDDQLHTSDPSRALSRLLLDHLTHHGLDLVEAPTPAYDRAALPDERLGFGQSVEDYTADAWLAEGQRLAARDEDEGSEAPTELVERVLAVCEQYYAAVTGTSSSQWDKELSRELVGVALRTVRRAEREEYPQVLEEYLRENRARLERLWRRCGPDGLYPRGVYQLVELPESFVLCERIDNAPSWLAGVWEEEGQEETPLERLQKAWLYDTGEEDGR